MAMKRLWWFKGEELLSVASWREVRASGRWIRLEGWGERAAPSRGQVSWLPSMHLTCGQQVCPFAFHISLKLKVPFG